jgi:hypothetical protein
MRVSYPILIDGLLSEPVWQNGEGVSDFRQLDPQEGAAPSMRTEVRVAFDDDALYIAALMHDPSPDSILARLSRRDVEVPSDRFTLYLDPYHDRRTGFFFTVNAAGTLSDGTLSNDGWYDYSWDGVWHGHARVDSAGWTAEMRIPYSQLRFERSSQPVWGVNFYRGCPRRNEHVYVAYQPKKESGFVSRFPDLVGIENMNPGRSIEVTPYVTTKAEYLIHDAGDPFNDGSRYVPDAGADLRMAVGRLTMNATVNPDFGQVEVDPAIVNLTDVESFFQEKRPFFVENSSIFAFGNQGANNYWGFNWPEPIFFYTRRIGRTPQGSTPDTSYEDVPLGTSILGAAKLTGKISPSVNFGTLHALTAREHADIYHLGSELEQEVEPLSYYGVARSLKEFSGRRFGLGLMGNAAVRFFEDDDLRGDINRSAFMGGWDGWAFLDRDQTWVVSGWSAASLVTGTAERMAAVQTSSRHYFQRPDADYLDVKTDVTSLSGFGSRYWLNKQKGSVICNAALGFMSPEFDVNDVGFMQRADVINGHFGGGYKWTTPGKLRNYSDVIGAAFASYDFGGNPTWGGLFLAGYTEFNNSYSWDYRTAFNPHTISNRRTRGGPLMINLPGYELGTYFDTAGKDKLFYFLDTGGYRQESGSWNYWLNPGVEWKPASNVVFRFGPRLSQVHEDAQYVDTISDATATATYASRYVFATLDQTEVAADIRLNWAFTPNFSLQFFAQPLISSGEYTGYKELARSRSYDFNRYGEGSSTIDPGLVVDPDGPGGPAPPFTLDNPNFDVLSLRGNAVLRWEYMPGSTFFLVWTQERSEEDSVGNFQFNESMRSLASAEANNIFLAKVSYYFNL